MKTIHQRSSHRRCSVKNGVLRNLEKFRGKHLCQRLFFNKVAGLRLATLLKKWLWHRCFPMNFAKFLRTPFLQNACGQMLLYINIYNYYNTFTSPLWYPTWHTVPMIALKSIKAKLAQKSKFKFLQKMKQKARMVFIHMVHMFNSLIHSNVCLWSITLPDSER